jgi:predicted phosphate transport protein (TIGR00153 family)
MRFSLIPKNYVFYDLFEESARKIVAAAEMLVDLLNHFENVDLKTARIKEFEHDADDITHEVYRQVYKSFITPMDREDIVALAQRLDDVMDNMEAATTAIRIYEIQEPTPAARALADLVRLQCVQIERATTNLRNRKEISRVLEQCQEINRLENEADSLFLSATAELFHVELSAADIIKWRDVYDQLERATDSAEQVAHVFEAIVLKNA